MRILIRIKRILVDSGLAVMYLARVSSGVSTGDPVELGTELERL